MGQGTQSLEAAVFSPEAFSKPFTHPTSPMTDALTSLPLASSPPLQGERVTFTGTLASMTHKQAHELTEQHGGQAQQHLGKHSTMVVVGEEGWPLEPDGRTSVKLRQAVEFLNQGQSLRIIKESEWLRLIGLEQRERETQRLHTPAMLQQLLGVPVSLVRRWERLGLVRAVQRVFRLPYFDVQEVAGVRKLHELLVAGVPRSQIEASLQDLKAMLPSAELPLSQLQILERDSRVVVRDANGLLDPRSGQRLFDFERTSDADTAHIDDASDIIPFANNKARAAITDHADWTAEDWLDQGCRLLEQDNPQAAIEALRLALMDRPCDPELHFYLADALYRTNNLHGALERLHVAIEHDHDDLQAWTQIGCIRHELGDQPGALDAFDIALKAHPAYADAMYHKAAVLAALGQVAEAQTLWHEYLKHDSRGPWAEAVRQQLAAHGL